MNENAHSLHDEKFRKELVYTKEFMTRIEARKYEKFLKVRYNKEQLIKKL